MLFLEKNVDRYSCARCPNQTLVSKTVLFFLRQSQYQVADCPGRPVTLEIIIEGGPMGINYSERKCGRFVINNTNPRYTVNGQELTGNPPHQIPPSPEANELL